MSGDELASLDRVNTGLSIASLDDDDLLKRIHSGLDWDELGLTTPAHTHGKVKSVKCSKKPAVVIPQATSNGPASPPPRHSALESAVECSNGPSTWDGPVECLSDPLFRSEPPLINRIRNMKSDLKPSPYVSAHDAIETSSKNFSIPESASAVDKEMYEVML